MTEFTNPHDTPDTDTSTALEPSVLEGELLSEAESAELDQRITAAKALAKIPARAVSAVRVVRTSDHHAAKASRVTLRAGMTVCQGVSSWGRRAWDAGTMGVYRRQIKTAEAMGDQERLAEWIERKNTAAERRHKRVMDLPVLVKGLAKTAMGCIAAFGAVVVLFALIAQLTGLADFLEFMNAVLGVFKWVFTAIAVAWTPLVISAPFMILLAAYREGRKHGNAPGWLATSSEADTDITIDENTIARALEALRIPQITAYLKKGLPLQYLVTARADGRGTYAVLRLPAGVTADRIARRRADLATGLHRLATEVWPTTGSEAGILDLWIADKGALAEGAGPYPLLTTGKVDIFKGVPFGKTLRGQPVSAPMMERNTIDGGLPGQGKSSASRAIMAGCALDPTVELRIWVPDSNFDFECFKSRCSRYVMGAEDEKIAEILEHLRELNAEVQTRGDLLVTYEIPAVTREYASKNVGLHPLVCLLEEAHVAIQHPLYGKEISKLLVDIVRLGRKRGIHLIVSTQAPTKDSMPRDVTRNCSNGIAFAVGDHVANDALLGQGAYAGGHRATELIPGTDRGTAVCKGFSGQRSDIVQVYYLDVSKDHDQVTPIITRSLELIAERGTGIPGTAKEKPAIQPARDLLEDLDEVLGSEPTRVADIPALLIRLAPQWIPYRSLTGKALREQLTDVGVKVPSTGNVYPVDPVTVREVLAQRATADLDDFSESELAG
jgi:S-DNA-T family DNA segregation ATPase FtsK/SpoIIIE